MSGPKPKKAKVSGQDTFIRLTDAVSGEDAPAVKAYCKRTLNSPDLPPPPRMRSLIQSMLRVIEQPDATPTPATQASKIGLLDAVRLLGIDYNAKDPNYIWTLTEELAQKAEPISHWAATAIQKIDGSKYMTKFQPETLVRTLFDILLCDRLEHLDDAIAARHLHVVPETQVNVEASDGVKISGRADWMLGYVSDSTKLHQMLVVVEAKSVSQISSALSQLLIYLAGVQDARAKAENANATVFGIATDSVYFVFAVLRSDRKAFVSKHLHATIDRNLVVAFIDHVLEAAIESSPHTTPTRRNNRTITRFDSSLRSNFVVLGTDEDKAEEDDMECVVVAEVGNISILRPQREFEIYEYE